MSILFLHQRETLEQNGNSIQNVMVIYFIPIPMLPSPFHRSLRLKMFWRNMTRIKMNSSVSVNLLEMFVGKVRRQLINYNILKTSLMAFLVPVAGPSTVSTLSSCFVCLCSGESPSQWEIEESVRFKDLYDQDKDGRLNREEQLRWVAPNSYGSAREEASLAGPRV